MSSSDTNWGFIGTLLGLATAFVVLLVYLIQWYDCSKAGGVFVQDAVWFSCVEPKR